MPNSNNNAYSCLEQASANSVSFTDENERSNKKSLLDNFYLIKTTCIASINRLLIGRINKNYLSNKFEMLSNSIKGNLDILMVSERSKTRHFQLISSLLRSMRFQ